MNILRAAGAATLCVGLLAGGVAAQEADDVVFEEAMDFAMHDAIYTMYHEIGHMLVGELGLPVLGKEEDAVDTLATIWLLTDDEDMDSWNALVDAADGWYFNAVNSTGSGVEDFSYVSDHSLDIQRAYNMVCLMVGAMPEEFKDTAESYEIDEDRQGACGYTYYQAEQAWTTLLEPYAVGEDGEQGEQIEVIYEDAGDYEMFAEALKDREILEYAANLVMNRYVLPGPVTFRAAQCGMANAYYSSSESEVVYCYELAEDLFNLYAIDIVGASAGDEEAGDYEEEEE